VQAHVINASQSPDPRWTTGRIGFLLKATMDARTNQTLINDLLELVAALDRRVPRLEREGERDISRDAQALRRAALTRIAELERSLSPAVIGVVNREKV
jgi:hypothetical protein